MARQTTRRSTRCGTHVQSVAALQPWGHLLDEDSLFNSSERGFLRRGRRPWRRPAVVLAAKEACFRALLQWEDLPRITPLDVEIQRRRNGRYLAVFGARLRDWTAETEPTTNVVVTPGREYVLASAYVTRRIPRETKTSYPARGCG